MPRINDVFLVGIVTERASAKYNKNGELIQVALPLLIMHGYRSYGLTFYTKDDDVANKGYDEVWVHTNNPKIAQEIINCRAYDIVEVKGVLRAVGIHKKTYCFECRTEIKYQTTRTTVYPIYFSRKYRISSKFGIDTDFSPNTGEIDNNIENEMLRVGLQCLKNCVELSNTIKIAGVIACEPNLYQTENKQKMILSFPLAVLRKYFIPEDDMKQNADFPRIKLYGDYAYQQSQILHKSNMLLIDGFLHSRQIIRKVECLNCMEKTPVHEVVTEVVPYYIEYLHVNVSDTASLGETNYKLPDSIKIQYIGTEADIDVQNRIHNGSFDSDEKSDFLDLDNDIVSMLKESAKENDTNNFNQNDIIMSGEDYVPKIMRRKQN